MNTNDSKSLVTSLMPAILKAAEEVARKFPEAQKDREGHAVIYFGVPYVSERFKSVMLLRHEGAKKPIQLQLSSFLYLPGGSAGGTLPQDGVLILTTVATDAETLRRHIAALLIVSEESDLTDTEKYPFDATASGLVQMIRVGLAVEEGETYVPLHL